MVLRPPNLTEPAMEVASSVAQTCCLLVHGYNALPQEFDTLAARLMSEGLAYRILRLPGDDGTRRALARSVWPDWLAALRAATWETARCFPSVVLIGHSLGAALALRVAADTTVPVAGVVALCPPLRLWPGEVTALGVIRHLIPWLPALPNDITPARRGSTTAIAHALSRVPLRPLASFFRALPDVRQHLRRVTCPALIVCARHDHVVPARDGIEAFTRLGSTQKELVVLERSFHAVLHDVEQEIVEQRVSTFCHTIQTPWQNFTAGIPFDLTRNRRYSRVGTSIPLLAAASCSPHPLGERCVDARPCIVT